jgi:6-phosphogluconolactonase (cycloisomerase 2 family)
MDEAVNRRTLLRGGLALAAASGTTARRSRAAEGPALFAYAGCYTTAERHARGDGIHVYRVDPETGAWTHFQHVGGLVNPSFLVLSRDQRFLYSVHGDEPYATSFVVDQATGHLTRLNQAATGGSNGVHQAIDASGKYMVVANYASGTVAVMPIRPDGTLGDQTQLARLEGQPGPHRKEQTGSHPHHVIFDPSGRFVLVPDKGLDRVFVFRFDASAGRLVPTEQGSVAARAGSAPRHGAFHPTLPVFWVLNEIGSSITTYAWDPANGSLHPLQVLPSTPPEFTGDNSTAEIAVSRDGRFVYGSNRGHNSVAVFGSNPKTGTLSALEWVPTEGKIPRFITFDPTHRFFYAANEQSDTIVTFRVDAAGGHLRPTGRVIHNASPVTIAFRS